MTEKTIKICGYDATYEEIENKCYIKTKKGHVAWEKTPDQVDHKPTNSVTGIIARNLIPGVERSFLKETHIMVALKKAIDWIEKGPDEETPKEELKTSPEPTQEVTEPAKEDTKEKEEPILIGEKKENDRNPDGTFKKGTVPNPAGRPKGAKSKFLTETLLKELRKEYGKVQKADGTVEVITHFEQMVREAIKHAIKGDVKYYNSIFDRVEGKPREDITIHKPEHRDLDPDEREELDEQLGIK